MKNEAIKEGLIMNEINEKNIELILKLIVEAKKLNFELSDLDAIDDEFVFSFKIKE